MPVSRFPEASVGAAEALSRRTLLRAAAGVPAIFGLAALLGCHGRGDVAGRPGGPAGGGGQVPASDTAATPTWWQYFVPKAKNTDSGEAIVVLRIPPSAEARAALGVILVDLVDHGSRNERLLMMGTKVGCLTDAQMKALVPTARPEDGLVLIDGDAKRVDGVPLPAADAMDRAKVRAALELVSYGKDDARLATRAKAVREKQKGETLDAYDRLKTPEDIERAAVIAYTIVPAIVAELRGSADATRRLAVQQLVDRSERDNHSPAHPGFRMPEGVVTDSEGGSCGGKTHGGGFVACGMAMPTPGSYRFLHFLVDQSG